MMKFFKKIAKQIIDKIDGLLFLMAGILIDITVYITCGLLAGGIVTAITLVIFGILIDLWAYFFNGRR